MIKLLHIENIAVIETVDIEFAPGLNVLTGETGAGKSIVIDALSALIGGRTSRDVIRTGAEYAYVNAVFTDPGEGPLAENNIMPDESGDVFVSRKITADGKSLCRVNGAPASAAGLRDLGAFLLDIHGQNDGRKLLDEGAHLGFLDGFCGLGGELASYGAAYAKLGAKKAEIRKLTMDEDEKERRIENLKHRVEEIARAGIKPGEHDEAAARREMLLNAAKLTEAVDTAFEALDGGDGGDGATALISEAAERLERAARFSDGLRQIAERLKDLRYAAQDVTDELRGFRGMLDFAPGELDALETRLDTLRRIIRRYGSEEEALEQLQAAEAELSDVEDTANKLEKLEKDLRACMQDATQRAEALSEKRKTGAKVLEKRVMEELGQLSMPGALFEVEIGAAQGEQGLDATGRDAVSFLISANAGEKPGRINRIASGGELARIMLALKNVQSGDADIGAMVFDEIDSGVSGIAAQRVGEKLSKLAQSRQVLCVTHLPQIAAMADTHFEIDKTTSGGRTYTRITKLDLEGRKNEIARLSGGENVTAAALSSAAEQLKAAQAYKEKL